MPRHSAILSFMRDMYRKTGSPAVLEAARAYRRIFMEQALPASATRQTPAIDYKGFMHTVAHAPAGTNQPDVCPAQVNTIINGTCTRDTGEETAKQKWEPPEFAQFTPGELNAELLHGRVGPTPKPENFNDYNRKTNEQLQKNGKKNQQDKAYLGVPDSTMPACCGFTITNPRYQQGVYAGDAGGASGGAPGA